MAHFAVSAVGADRPGIVAAVTGVFVEHGCNLEDTSMTILRGHFAMMLIVAAPDDVSGEELESALAAPGVEVSAVETQLKALAAELGVECSLHPSEADVL